MRLSSAGMQFLRCRVELGGAVPGGLPVAPPAGRATGIDGNNLVAGETRGS